MVPVNTCISSLQVQVQGISQRKNTLKKKKKDLGTMTCKYQESQEEDKEQIEEKQ